MKILLMPIYLRLFFAFVLPSLSANGQIDSLQASHSQDTNLVLAANNGTTDPVLNTGNAAPVQAAIPGMSITGFTSFADTIQPYQETGIASWYGPKSWNGRLTSSGERFYLDSLTAAHKTLPFGTVVQVRNTVNDSVIYVKITDRLPQNSKRCIDLTPRAAKALGFYSRGLTKVEILSVGTAPVIKPKKATAGKS